MGDPRADPNVREALTELDLYLSDTLPPLVVADSVELLVGLPAEVIADAIRTWTAAQYAKDASASVSDYLFHAIKKIHMMGEFHLVPAPGLSAYLQRLKPLLLAECPADDRERFAENLARLDETVTSGTATPIARLHRQASPPRGSAAAAPADAGETAADRRRLGLLLERLESQARQASAPAGRAALSETLAAAARESETAREIEGHLTRLRGMGIEVGTADVFRALAGSLPSWVLPTTGEWRGGAPASPAADAMQRMVAEAADPRETSRRFGELVRAAVERFNEGSLPQAVTTLETAERLIAEKKVDPGSVDLARRKGDEALDQERLRAAADNPAHHAGLRRLLNFFSSLSPEGLLDQLSREEKRDRRRLILALLEIHGEGARAAALATLAAAPTEHAQHDWYFRRNLLYLLRRIPRPADAPVGEEVEVTARHATPLLAPPLVKEAVANLAQLRDDRSEAALVALLGDLEEALAKGESGAEAKEFQQLLDRVAAALARIGTPGARRALLGHAGKRDPKLGDTAARLAELAGQDLSSDPETIGRLLEQLKSNRPFKLFGLALHQNDQLLARTVEALSGTPAPTVVTALDEIASRFSGKEIGKVAARVVAGLRKPAPEAAPSPAAAPTSAPAPATAALNGDLEVFGLPALLQSLSDSGVSGSLTLRDAKGSVFGTMRLRGGKLRACKAGHLTGEDAYYQLLERPCPGQFQFLKTDTADETASGEIREILPLTLEAMRRHDELRQMTALVPDRAELKPTDKRASPHPSEKDGLLQKELWSRVSRGATPLECEADVRADAYRVRRLLAHWLEEGALTVA